MEQRIRTKSDVGEARSLTRRARFCWPCTRKARKFLRRRPSTWWCGNASPTVRGNCTETSGTVCLRRS